MIFVALWHKKNSVKFHAVFFMPQSYKYHKTKRAAVILQQLSP
jgi:hypothetical protein